MIGSTYMLRTATTSYTSLKGFPEDKLKAAHLPFADFEDPVFIFLVKLGRSLYECARNWFGIKTKAGAWMYGPESFYNEEQNGLLTHFAALQACLDDGLGVWAQSRGLTAEMVVEMESCLPGGPHPFRVNLKSQPWWSNTAMFPEPDLKSLHTRVEELLAKKIHCV